MCSDIFVGLLNPWRRRHYVRPKRRSPLTPLLIIKSQKTRILYIIVVKTARIISICSQASVDAVSVIPGKKWHQVVYISGLLCSPHRLSLPNLQFVPFPQSLSSPSWDSVFRRCLSMPRCVYVFTPFQESS